MNKGFTLLEFVIIIFIIGILAAIAIPRLYGIKKTQVIPEQQVIEKIYGHKHVFDNDQDFHINRDTLDITIGDGSIYRYIISL